MTRIKDTLPQGAKQKQTKPGSRWVKTVINGTAPCQMALLGEQARELGYDGNGIAYAKMSLMESGAVMARFPAMSMTAAAARSMLGAQWLELREPLVISASVLGREVTLAAGRHPLVFVLENWVALFRPQIDTPDKHTRFSHNLNQDGP